MPGLGWKKSAALGGILISGVAFIVCGIVFNDIVDVVIRAKIKETLPLRNGTIAFKFWQKPPVPVSFGIYVFHVVNPAEVLTLSEAPVVIEKGPYVYRMSIEKTDIRYHHNNTVEYVQPQSFVFDREVSIGPETDRFLTINIPYITVATLLQYEFSWLQDMVNTYFISQGENAFMNRSVYEIWWGYEDPILEELAKILHTLNMSIPIFTGKFGFFMDKNNTGDGLYNVFSGLDGQFDNYVHIDRWNGIKNLSIWTTDYANEIRGTDGSMQAPFVNSESQLSVFDAYLHRSLKLQYSTTSSYQGVRTLRFNVPYSEFANADENPDNAGFCTPNCIPSGAYNFSVASYYAPIYVSLPHFVGGDPYYNKLVRGLNPSQSRHQPVYDIHALTGVSLVAARRYQINVRTQSFQHFTKFENFPLSYLPVLWIDGKAETDVDTAAMFKEQIQDTLDAMPFVRGTMLGVGVALCLLSIGLFIYWRRKLSKFLQGYERVPDSEDAKLNGNSNKSYGAVESLTNNLNTAPDDTVTIIQHSVPNDQTPAHTNNSVLESTTENLEPTLHNDSSHDQSLYFDSRTSQSSLSPEKYHSLDESY